VKRGFGKWITVDSHRWMKVMKGHNNNGGRLKKKMIMEKVHKKNEMLSVRKIIFSDQDCDSKSS